jgi:TctA family transporter
MHLKEKVEICRYAATCFVAASEIEGYQVSRTGKGKSALAVFDTFSVVEGKSIGAST